MLLNIESAQARVKAPPRISREPALHSLEGTIQRVNYRTREIRVIAESRTWEFALSDGCQLWFNGNIAPFRCFQPLDHVRILYAEYGAELIAKALYLWVDEPGSFPCVRNGETHEIA